MFQFIINILAFFKSSIRFKAKTFKIPHIFHTYLPLVLTYHIIMVNFYFYFFYREFLKLRNQYDTLLLSKANSLFKLSYFVLNVP